MALLSRLRRFFNPPLPPQRHMCIRCDEIREDVPFEGTRCPPCQAIVDEIFRANPQLMWDYYALMARTRRSH